MPPLRTTRGEQIDANELGQRLLFPTFDVDLLALARALDFEFWLLDVLPGPGDCGLPALGCFGAVLS